MLGVDWSVWLLLGTWTALVMLCIMTAGIKYHKYLVNKKNRKNRPKLTLIQGGKKDGPY